MEDTLLVGAHESIAGGYDRSIRRAAEDECEAVQIFTGPPGRWKIPPVGSSVAAAFNVALSENGSMPVLVHGIYLINPASPDPDIWVRSLVALKEEFARCSALGIGRLVIHPGSHKGTSPEDGIKRAAEMIQSVFEEYAEGPEILLENTAGSGSSIGSSFHELASIRELVVDKNRVRYCLDTAHAFAAGYDLRDSKKLNETLNRFDSEAGLENIKAVHLNDSQKELGSRVDRHERIGEGQIGRNGFKAIVLNETFSGVPGILETQPLPDRQNRYRPQVRFLKKLRGTAP
jgi:deoxyribonuclease-4